MDVVVTSSDEDEALLRYLRSGKRASEAQDLADARSLFGQDAKPRRKPFTEIDRLFLATGRAHDGVT
jgi:hypothetical protein